MTIFLHSFFPSLDVILFDLFSFVVVAVWARELFFLPSLFLTRVLACRFLNELCDWFSLRFPFPRLLLSTYLTKECQRQAAFKLLQLLQDWIERVKKKSSTLHVKCSYFFLSPPLSLRQLYVWVAKRLHFFLSRAKVRDQRSVSVENAPFQLQHLHFSTRNSQLSIEYVDIDGENEEWNAWKV